MSQNSAPLYRPVTTTNTASFMNKVYLWMMFALAISAGCAYGIASHPQTLLMVVRNPFIFYGAFIAQLVAVFAFRRVAMKGNLSLTSFLYVGYAVLSGVTLSIICAAFSAATLTYAFLSTAGAFAGLSLFGFITKRDLGPIGSFCMMGVVGLLIVYLISYFVPSMMTVKFQMAINVLGVLIFAGLTAYDTQRIKAIGAAYATESGDTVQSIAIYGALILYIDFINLFINLAMLFGGGSRK